MLPVFIYDRPLRFALRADPHANLLQEIVCGGFADDAVVPAERIPDLVILFELDKTGSLLGPVLVHAASDFLGNLAVTAVVLLR